MSYLVLNCDTLTVEDGNGRFTRLTPAEFAILRTLAGANGVPMNAETLSNVIMPGNAKGGKRNISAYIDRIRRKLVEAGLADKDIIYSQAHAGYLINRITYPTSIHGSNLDVPASMYHDLRCWMLDTSNLISRMRKDATYGTYIPSDKYKDELSRLSKMPISHLGLFAGAAPKIDDDNAREKKGGRP